MGVWCLSSTNFAASSLPVVESASRSEAGPLICPSIAGGVDDGSHLTSTATDGEPRAGVGAWPAYRCQGGHLDLTVRLSKEAPGVRRSEWGRAFLPRGWGSRRTRYSAADENGVCAGAHLRALSLSRPLITTP